MTKNLCRLSFLFCVIFAQTVFSQKDTLLPLGYNPVLQKPIANLSAQKALNTSTGADTIELPFYEDFAYYGPYPVSSKWLNSNSVFVNNTFAKHPRTIGVATFDGLKSTGYPYKPYGSSGTENADTLASKYIRLDSITGSFIAITPADSVYLSFYYQSWGNGHKPNTSHTLLLDFYNPTTGAWVNKMTLSRPTSSNKTVKDTTFTRVMIPITDPQYFKKDFRFRFRNKNSATGSVNHWHIDNIYLGKDRGKTDTTLRDLSFVYEPQSLLDQYTAMPFNQYTGASQMAAHSYLTIRNNDVSPANFTGFIQIKDNANVLELNDTTGSDNAMPFFPNGYVSNPDITDFLNSTVSPQINNYAFNGGSPLNDSITYTIKHFLRTSGSDVNHGNDTVIYQQKFLNYYSYDDGTAESSWGINAQSPEYYGAEAAVKFSMPNSDTLRAIDIFFNPVPNPSYTIMQIASLTFGLRVWGDNGGIPGTYLYDDGGAMDRNPVYYDWGTNNYFTRYYLNYPLVMSAGTFYTGIKQEDLFSLNIGFDQNTNTQTKIFYNVGSWQNASFKGSLMIRPVFGDSLWAATGINSEIRNQNAEIKLYPNPANDKVYLLTDAASQDLSVEVMDALGSLQLKQTVNSDRSISTADLRSGFYFIRIYKGTQLLSTQKIIVSH
ncbi:MAG: T9SS type A sorting domain-containing protein [Bacteroidota bacterium]|nr:T9SS type A sorting domain-containing protein [Bacteroidota bacterium]